MYIISLVFCLIFFQIQRIGCPNMIKRKLSLIWGEMLNILECISVLGMGGIEKG